MSTSDKPRRRKDTARFAAAILTRSDFRALRAFIEEAPVAIAIFDREIRYLQWSSRWVSDYGLEDRDLSGLSHYEVFPEISQEWKDLHQRCLAGEKLSRDHDEFVRADGTSEILRWEISPWRDGLGGIGGILMFSEIITEQVETQRRLREGEILIDAFFQEAPLGLLLMTPGGRWVRANPRMLEMVGRTPEELEAGLHEDAIRPDDAEPTDPARVEALRLDARESVRNDAYLRPDGRVLQVRRHDFPAQREGHDLLYSVVEDVTEEIRRDAEQQRLREELALSSRLAALGTLAAGIAHEVNNPLMIVDSGLRSLRRDLRSGREVQLEAVDEVLEAVGRIARIVGEFSASARPSASSAEDRFDLHDLVDRTYRLTKGICSAEGITLTTHKEARSAAVHGDEGRFQQVLLNLISNSRDAVRGRDQREIVIRTQTSPIDADGVILEVVDTGSGMSHEVLKRVFDSFFTTKAPGSGTGLGLSITHSIIEEMGGRIEIDSRENVGTRVVVTLRRAEGVPVRRRDIASSVSRERPTLVNLRLLVCDDEPALARLLTAYVAQFGVKVTTVTSGEEALDVLAREPFDFLLTDLKMPGMGGWELLDAIARRPALSTLRLLVMSGEPNERERLAESRFAERIEAFLGKPFRPNELLRILMCEE